MSNIYSRGDRMGGSDGMFGRVADKCVSGQRSRSEGFIFLHRHLNSVANKPWNIYNSVCEHNGEKCITNLAGPWPLRNSISLRDSLLLGLWEWNWYITRASWSPRLKKKKKWETERERETSKRETETESRLETERKSNKQKRKRMQTEDALWNRQHTRRMRGKKTQSPPPSLAWLTWARAQL